MEKSKEQLKLDFDNAITESHFKNRFKAIVDDTKSMGDLLDEQGRKEMYIKRHEKFNAVTLAAEMKSLKDVMDWMESVSKFANAEYDMLRMVLIPQAMEKEGLESPLNVSGVGRVSLTGDLFISVTDKEVFHAWLHSHKMGDLIIESVNSSTLKAWAKERIKSGKIMPDGSLVKVTPYTRASITKTTK